MRWRIKRKEGLLKILRLWRRQYQLETTLEAKKQRALMKFGFTAEGPDGENGQGNVTRTRRHQGARHGRRGWMRSSNRSLFGAVT